MDFPYIGVRDCDQKMSSYTGIDRRKKNEGPPKGREERRTKAMGEDGQGNITISIKTFVAIILAAAGIGAGSTTGISQVIANRASTSDSGIEKRLDSIEQKFDSLIKAHNDSLLQNEKRFSQIEAQTPRRR